MNLRRIITNMIHPDYLCATEEVSEGEDVMELVMEMFAVCTIKKGIGLAANQLGDRRRVIVIDCDGFQQAFVNPRITKYRGKPDWSMEEGCFSLPGYKRRVWRYKFIVIEGRDPETGESRKFKLRGWPARCAQHEVDHLNQIAINSDHPPEREASK